jgi:hypothetical protein
MTIAYATLSDQVGKVTILGIPSCRVCAPIRSNCQMRGEQERAGQPDNDVFCVKEFSKRDHILVAMP